MLKIIPLSLKEANELVERLHRHHKRVVGHKISVGVEQEGQVVGAVILGRPVARAIDYRKTIEVTRLVTDGTKNACSFLYAAGVRLAKAMGYEVVQTYILKDELGTSLKASGWVFDGLTAGGNWNHSWRKGRREDQPMCQKQRWIKRC